MSFLHPLQSVLSHLLFLYYNTYGLLQSNQDYIEEIGRCMKQIEQVMERKQQEKQDIQMEEWRDADAFLDWFLKM